MQFRNPDGVVVQFGQGAYLQTWRSDFGVAHELWVASDTTCFHSPGPGDRFQEDDLDSVLHGVRWIFVVSQAATYEEFIEQRLRAEAIVGTPWNLVSANCQQTASLVATGIPNSFQLAGALGLVLIVAFAAAIFPAQQPRRRPRRGR